MTEEKLTTKLVADARQFNKGVDSAEKKVSAFAGSAGKLLGALGLGAAVKGLSDAFFEMSNSLDEVGKSADRLGIGTEALTGFRHAAEQAGASAQAMDNALRDMQKNAVKAADGAKGLESAFGELGIQADKFLELSTEEQFAAIADGIKAIENPARRTKISMELLGKSGSDLAGTLQLGAEGLEKMKEEAIAMGIAVDRDTIASLERLNDTFDRVQKRWRGVMTDMLLTMAPVMEGFGTMAEFILEQYQRIGVDSESLTNFMVEAFAQVVGAISRFSRAVIAGLDFGFNLLRTALAEMVNFTVRQIFSMFDLLPDRMKSWMGIGEAPQIDTSQWVSQMQFAAGEFVNAFTGANDEIELAFRRGASAGDSQAPRVPGLPPAEVVEEAALELGKKAAEKLQEGMAETFTEAREAGLDPFEQWIQDSLALVENLQGSVVGVLDQIASGTAALFSDAAGGAKDFKQSFEDLVLSISRGIISTVLQVMIQTALAAALAQTLWKPAAILASTATLGQASGIGAAAVAASISGGSGGSVPSGFLSGAFDPSAALGALSVPVTVNNSSGASVGVSSSGGGVEIAVEIARQAVQQDFADSLGNGSGSFADSLRRFT